MIRHLLKKIHKQNEHKKDGKNNKETSTKKERNHLFYQTSSRISFYWTSSSRKIASTRLDSIVQCMSFCGHGSSRQIGLLDVQQILLDVHQSRRFGEMTFSLPGKSEVRIMRLANIIAGLKNRQLGFENSMRILNSESVLKKKEVCA